MTSEHADVAASSRASAFALVGAAVFAGFAEFGAVASLGDVAHHFGHASATATVQSVVGLSGSALGVGLALFRVASLGALPLTALADRYGRRALLHWSLVAGLACTALAAASPGYWFFVACFALGRPALSTASALTQVMTVEVATTKQRVSRLTYLAAGSGVGAGIAAIGHGLIRGPDSFRWLFALALVPLCFVGRLLKQLPEPSDAWSRPVARLGSVPRGDRANLVVVACVIAVIGVISGPANGFVFVYGESLLKIAPSRVALLVGASALTGLAGLLLGRSAASRWGRRWTVAAGVVASGLAATLAYSGGRVHFALGYLCGVGAGGFLTPAANAISTELFPHGTRATAAGWIVVAGVVGATLGLFCFGWVADVGHATSVNAFRIPALVTFVPLLPVVVLLRRLPEVGARDLV